MNKVIHSITELVGETPLFRSRILSSATSDVLLKLEFYNPAKSVKDRIALAMIESAEQTGALKSGFEIIEATSGNTGIGLAAIAASKGYKITIVMPESMSIERRRLLKALGANLVLTPKAEGMKGAITKAEALAQNRQDVFMPRQFENMANPEVHFKTTGPEIWQQTAGKVDVFVSGIGTGGTISGVGRYLKSQNPNIKIIAVEPDESPVLSGGNPGPHVIQGIGAGFIPKTLDTSIYDEVIRVKGDDALTTARRLAQEEGLLVGISSGAMGFAAAQLAAENAGKCIVTLAPSFGERYLSTVLFAEDA